MKKIELVVLEMQMAHLNILLHLGCASRSYYTNFYFVKAVKMQGFSPYNTKNSASEICEGNSTDENFNIML